MRHHSRRTSRRELLRGERPALLVEADATDPAATGNALGVAARARGIGRSSKDLTGPLAPLAGGAGAVRGARAPLYNPEGITQYNIVPGLMGVILTMTMVMMTGLAITRERERGTMENLLATPAQPLEVMIGKIVPYIVDRPTSRSTIILLAARCPVRRADASAASPLLYVVALLFIAANLDGRHHASRRSRSNQLQAMQMTFFFFLPSILLSGFMFPFRGMPDWAQWIGEVLPLDALPAHRARHPAQGQRLGRPVAEHLAADRVHGRGHGHRGDLLPQDAGLR